MVSIALNKTNAKRKSRYRQSRHLTPTFRRILRITPVQPYFHCGCSSWFFLFNRKLKIKKLYNNLRNFKKLKTNECIRFCEYINLLQRCRVNLSQRRKLNWLTANDRVEYCNAKTVFEYWNRIVQEYIHDILKI